MTDELSGRRSNNRFQPTVPLRGPAAEPGRCVDAAQLNRERKLKITEPSLNFDR